ncbi:MAG: BACON domain-containing protein [Prevotella sp.]|nr:BACON domain-containing protein [Prevotella sp.]
MRLFRKIGVGMMVCGLVVACEKAEPLTQYIISVLKPMTGEIPLSCVYANQTEDSLVFYANRPWEITTYNGDDSWIDIHGEMKGKANMTCHYGVSFTQNNSGKARYTTFRITDSEKPDKAYASLAYQQYATRIDGSLGNAPLVKSVMGSDGSKIEIAYDGHARPTSLSMKKGGTERSLQLSYDDYERTVRVTEISQFDYKDTIYLCNNAILEGAYQAMSFAGVDNNFYDPYCLMELATNSSVSMRCTVNGDIKRTVNANHVVQYRSFLINEVFPVTFENAFKVLDQCGDFYTQYGIYYNGNGSLGIDDSHVADSMVVYRHYPDNKDVYETYQLTYGNVSNCATNIDVNHLVEGVEKCNPFMLLSMFKMARFTQVIAEAKGKYNSYQVETTANGDSSIRTMTVRDQNGASITFNFTY